MSRAGEIWQGTIKRCCPFRAQLESTYGIPLDQGPPKLPEAQIRDQDGKGAFLGAEKLQKLINQNLERTGEKHIHSHLARYLGQTLVPEG